MDFNTALNELTKAPSQADVAREAGVSLSAIRQARLAEPSSGHREPPMRWREAVARLAQRRIARLEKLLRELDPEGPKAGRQGRAAPEWGEMDLEPG